MLVELIQPPLVSARRSKAKPVVSRVQLTAEDKHEVDFLTALFEALIDGGSIRVSDCFGSHLNTKTFYKKVEIKK